MAAMEFNSIPLFGVVKKRLAWLTQRQEVLAHNVANADTPGFRARDLEPFRFREMIRRETMQINMNTTRADHLGGRRRRIRDFAEEESRRPFETAPAGNAVVLEEQMAKVSATGFNYKLATQLYRKHLRMFSSAVRSRQ